MNILPRAHRPVIGHDCENEIRPGRHSGEPLNRPAPQFLGEGNGHIVPYVIQRRNVEAFFRQTPRHIRAHPANSNDCYFCFFHNER
jgi:hypothetical protein